MGIFGGLTSQGLVVPNGPWVGRLLSVGGMVGRGGVGVWVMVAAGLVMGLVLVGALVERWRGVGYRVERKV